MHPPSPPSRRSRRSTSSAARPSRSPASTTPAPISTASAPAHSPAATDRSPHEHSREPRPNRRGSLRARSTTVVGATVGADGPQVALRIPHRAHIRGGTRPGPGLMRRLNSLTILHYDDTRAALRFAHTSHLTPHTSHLTARTGVDWQPERCRGRLGDDCGTVPPSPEARHEEHAPGPTVPVPRPPGTRLRRSGGPQRTRGLVDRAPAEGVERVRRDRRPTRSTRLLARAVPPCRRAPVSSIRRQPVTCARDRLLRELAHWKPIGLL
ncbi:UNVERIFIED_CONTAM: hypothetical protein RKD50_000231 [Streptomyces canus]